MVDQELKKTLWAAADKLRSNMDAAEYIDLVLQQTEALSEAWR